MRLKVIKSMLFILIGLYLFIGVQNVLKRDWYYPSMSEAPGDMMDEYYQLADEVDMQVVFFGSSISEWDIDPMKIYKDTGIVTFNMASSGQPFPVSYYLCKEMFKSQHPQVIVMEVSGMFADDFFDGGYHYILDTMPLSRNKLEFASYYASKYAELYGEYKKTDAFISALLPFYQYHSRWSSLSGEDFKKRESLNLYRKGHLPCTGITLSGLTISWMNEIEREICSNDGWTIVMENGIPQKKLNTVLSYSPQINEEYWNMLLDIKELCERNGTELLLIRAPAFGHPIVDGGAWTLLKSQILKEKAKKDDFDLLDLQYDVDLGIDWSRDAGAGTQHLNYLGATKLTGYLEEFLQDRYRLSGEVCEAYEEDMPLYNKICQLSELQMTDNLFQYFEQLSDFNNITIFFAAADDTACGLTDEICQVLNALGLQVDFHNLKYSDAYLAVIENGVNVYEAYSNRKIAYSNILNNGIGYSITSSGFQTGSEAAILIDGKNYARNSRGMNIVVYDNIHNTVLDSVSFDMHDVNYALTAVHTGSNDFLLQFENKLMIQGGRNK